MSKFEKSIADAVFDGEQRGIGLDFWISTTVVSTGITTATFDITLASSGGELVVEDIILKTDNLGLAGGSTLKVVCNNSKGTSLIMSEGVGYLGAYTTRSLLDSALYEPNMNVSPSASAKRPYHNVRTILESGKKVQIMMSDTAGTGAGRIDIYIKFRRLAAGADIVVA